MFSSLYASIDNWFSDHTNHKIDWESYIHNSVVYKEQIRKRQETSPLRYDPKFVDM